MKKFLVGLFLSFGLVLNPALAEELVAQELEAQVINDQHGSPLNLSATTQWLIFSHDKDGGAWTKEALDQLEITNLEAKGGIYLADISKMPGIITRLFALPKMKKYNFSMALDKTGELSENLPKEDSRVALIKLDGLKIVEVIQAKSVDEIKAFLDSY